MGTLRDQILAAEDLPREQVTVDEWGLSSESPPVYVRGLTSAEQDEWERLATEPDGDGTRRPRKELRNVRARFLVNVLVDEDNGRIFTDDDAELLAGKSAAVLIRLFGIAIRLSGLSGQEEEEPNPSTGDQQDSNSSGSPSPSVYPTRTT